MRRLIILGIAGLALLVVARPPGASAQGAAPDDEAPSPVRTDTTVHAADVVGPAVDEPHVTLSEWAADRRLRMMDRRHARVDRTYDRGVFRHITPPMDREYALDMVNYGFSPLEDYAWKHVESGMRARAGSIVRAAWAIHTDVKHTADIGDGHTLRVDAVLQQDARANRALVEVNYDWAVARNHHVGIRHSFAEYKPDLDPSLFYQYGNRVDGRVRAEMTLLNAYNNLIFGTLGTSPKDERFTRIYDRIPVLGQVTLETPDQYPVRAELHVGWQPESELTVQAKDDPAYRYRDQESAHYVAALVEYNRGPVTTGLIAQRDRSALDRQGLRPGVTSDYETEQRFQRVGAFVVGTWRSFRGEAWFFLEDYYDRQHGSDFSLSTIGRAMNYTQYRKNYRVRVAYVPNPTGWYTSLGYLGMSRRMGEQPWIMGDEWTNHWYEIGPSNYRMSGVVGYRFGAGAVALGINFDLDGDLHSKAGPDYEKKRFDNGFIRFSLSW
jgi:hypothetical protein